MTTHLDADTIAGFAEGTLPGDEQAAAAAHLQACPHCREEVTWVRTLRERVRELPEERTPPRDAWPAIEQRIRAGARPPLDDGDQLAVARRRRAARWRLPGVDAGALRRAAAILLLMGLPAGATYLLMRPALDEGRTPVAAVDPAGRATDARPGAGDPGDGMRFVGNTPEALAAAYEPAIGELWGILEANRDRLRPETIRVLEENLRIIDDAIEDFYRALEADPASLDTARHLNGMYETKVQLLRQAASLTRGA